MSKQKRKIQQGRQETELVCPICGNPIFEKTVFCKYCRTELKDEKKVTQKINKQ